MVIEGIQWNPGIEGVSEYPVDWIEARPGDWFMVNGKKFELLKVSQHVVNVRIPTGYTAIMLIDDLRDLELQVYRKVGSDK